VFTERQVDIAILRAINVIGIEGLHERHRLSEPLLEIGKGLLSVVMFRHFDTRKPPSEGKPETAVINIMDALKESMQAKGRAKVRDAVRKRMGKAAPKGETPRPAPRSRAVARRAVH
jgi:hypothetical protein